MLIDSTKLSCFMECPRKFFFRFRKHWRPEHPNLHLEFGIAWHDAKEHLLLHPDDLAGAMEKFLEHYRKFYSPIQDTANEPKAPASALLALQSYAERLKTMDREILHTEVAGLVPLAEDVDVAFKIDAIVRDATGIWVIDHKTASRLSAGWIDSWSVSPQLCIYVHVANHFYGMENVAGARVEGTIFRKNDHEHIEVPVRKATAAFGALFWSILHNVDLINWSIVKESEALESDEILTAWPMRPQGCMDYGSKCRYFDYCTVWSNPLGCECPSGFIVEEWNPLEVHKDKKRLEVTNEHSK